MTAASAVTSRKVQSSNAVATPKATDYISHHMPVPDRFSETLNLSKQLNGKPKDGVKEEQKLSSQGMTSARLTAAGFILAGHFFSLIAIYDMMFNMTFLTACKWVLASIVMYIFSGTIGITAGAHRLWAHRSYKANLPARIIIMMCNCVANQSSILHWAIEHRVHHRHSDTDADPHNISRGFWYAHMLWLFSPRTDAFVAARKKVDASDLLADEVVMFQDKYYGILGPFFCYLMPALVGYYFTGTFWRSFLILSMFRWTMTLHATWCVNSIAHTFGTRPYRSDERPAEFAPVSFISGGEGWHNWHHAFPWDYAASEMRADVFWRFNLARFWIDSFASIGWVWDRKVQRHGDIYKNSTLLSDDHDHHHHDMQEDVKIVQ